MIILGYVEASSTPAEVSALSLVRKLRAGSERSGANISLAAWEVRLLLKTRQFTAARQVAESTLALAPGTDEEGGAQASLAALTGRVNLAADLYSRHVHWPFVTPDGRLVQTPAAVRVTANRLLVFAAFGTPIDSISALAARLRAEVDRWVDLPLRQDVWDAVMFQPSLLAFPVLPPPAGQQLPTARVETALARGDYQLARLEFAALNTVRQFRLPGDVALDHAVLEARLLVHLGDTTAARSRLEPFLLNPAGLGTEATELITQSAAVGRILLLSWELNKTDPDSSLKALWLHADQPLASRVIRNHPM